MSVIPRTHLGSSPNPSHISANLAGDGVIFLLTYWQITFAGISNISAIAAWESPVSMRIVRILLRIKSCRARRSSSSMTIFLFRAEKCTLVFRHLFSGLLLLNLFEATWPISISDALGRGKQPTAPLAAPRLDGEHFIGLVHENHLLGALRATLSFGAVFMYPHFVGSLRQGLEHLPVLL